MSLLEKIKADQLVARKEKNALKAQLLTTLLGEAVMVGKNDGNRESTDTEVQAVIKKFIKNIKETMTALGWKSLGAEIQVPVTETMKKNIDEKAILETYMPAQLTAEDIMAILTAMGDGVKHKGKLMAHLKNTYPGQYDGEVAGQVVDQFIKM